jgi:hypothetical protein
LLCFKFCLCGIFGLLDLVVEAEVWKVEETPGLMFCLFVLVVLLSPEVEETSGLVLVVLLSPKVKKTSGLQNYFLIFFKILVMFQLDIVFYICRYLK